MRWCALSVVMFGGVATAQVKVPPPVYIPPPTPQLTTVQTDDLFASAARVGAETAVTPLRVAAADPAVRGKLLLTRYPINPPSIAVQGLSALGAVRAMLDGKERVLPLSIVGKVAPGAAALAAVMADPKRRAWCNGKEERGDDIRCYQDTDGDGRFDTARWGGAYSDDSPYTLYMVRKAEALPVPLPYTTVDAVTLPALQLIYQGCRVTDRIQYAARIGVAGDGDVKTFGCPNAAQPIGKSELVGPGRYRIDRVVVDIAYTTPEEATTTLVEPIAAGTVLDRIDVGKPLALLGERKGWPIEQAEMRARYARPAYAFVGTPTLAATGGAGATLLSGDYRYGYTARIAGDAQRSTVFSGKKPAFAAGDALYGIPMQSPLVQQQFGEPLMMWCAPKERKPGEWRANCLQLENVTRGVYTDVFNALWIEQIPASASNSDAIELEEGPAELPRSSIRYDLWKWTPNRLILKAVVVHDGKDMPWRQVDVARMKDGTALMPVAGGVIAVRPSADGLGFAAEAIRPLENDRSAQPKPMFWAQMIDDAKMKDGTAMTTARKAELLDDD